MFFFKDWMNRWDGNKQSLVCLGNPLRKLASSLCLFKAAFFFFFFNITHPFPLSLQSEWFIEMHILFAIDYIHDLLRAFCSASVMSAGLQTALNWKHFECSELDKGNRCAVWRTGLWIKTRRALREGFFSPSLSSHPPLWNRTIINRYCQ